MVITMISGKDLESYLVGFQNEEYQGKYYKTFKELSQRIPEDSESNMVESEEMAFGTDELKQYFIKTGNLRSADALYFFTRKQKHHIYLSLSLVFCEKSILQPLTISIGFAKNMIHSAVVKQGQTIIKSLLKRLL